MVICSRPKHQFQIDKLYAEITFGTSQIKEFHGPSRTSTSDSIVRVWIPESKILLYHVSQERQVAIVGRTVGLLHQILSKHQARLPITATAPSPRKSLNLILLAPQEVVKKALNPFLFTLQPILKDFECSCRVCNLFSEPTKLRNAQYKPRCRGILTNQMNSLRQFREPSMTFRSLVAGQNNPARFVVSHQPARLYNRPPSDIIGCLRISDWRILFQHVLGTYFPRNFPRQRTPRRMPRWLMPRRLPRRSLSTQESRAPRCGRSHAGWS